jgi:hypothetical protein
MGIEMERCGVDRREDEVTNGIAQPDGRPTFL